MNAETLCILSEKEAIGDPPAVTFLGWQPGVGTLPAFALWNLLVPVAAYPAHATVTTATLRRLGIRVQEPPASLGSVDNGC